MQFHRWTSEKSQDSWLPERLRSGYKDSYERIYEEREDSLQLQNALKIGVNHGWSHA